MILPAEANKGRYSLPTGYPAPEEHGRAVILEMGQAPRFQEQSWMLVCCWDRGAAADQQREAYENANSYFRHWKLSCFINRQQNDSMIKIFADSRLRITYRLSSSSEDTLFAERVVSTA
jgi:hypothetical protein